MPTATRTGTALRRPLLAAAFAFALGTAALADDEAKRHPVGPTPGPIAAADVNGDGKPDLVVVNVKGGSLSVLLNDGKGAFKKKDTATSAGAWCLAVGDLNGDKRADVVVASTKKLSVFLAGKDGALAAPKDYPGLVATKGLVLGDVNGDGKLDAIAVGGGGGAIAFGGEAPKEGPERPTIAVYLGDGKGAFKNRADVPAGKLQLEGVAVGDWNADGKLDLAINQVESVVTWKGDGAGGFLPLTGIDAGLGKDAVVVAIATGDFNGDKIVDLVMAGSDKSLNVYPGTGRGLVGKKTILKLDAGSPARFLLAADVDGDGKVDLLTVNPEGGGEEGMNVSIFHGKGDGTFEKAVHFRPTPDTPAALAVADFDGDGKPELAVTMDPAEGRAPNDKKPGYVAVLPGR